MEIDTKVGLWKQAWRHINRPKFGCKNCWYECRWLRTDCGTQ